MNKYIFGGLIISSFTFTGCSNNDDNNIIEPVQNKVLVSKVTTTYYNNPSSPETNTAVFEYNSQGELTKMLSEGRTAMFEYNAAGNPIKTSYYKADGSLEYYLDYIYNGAELVENKAIYSNPDYNRKYSYIYNNGKVIASTLCQSQDCSAPITSSYAYSGNNIAVETSVLDGTMITSTKREFTYDDKFNPFTYTNKYLRIMMGGAYIMSTNNYIAEKISYKDSAGNWIQNQNITYDIQYNSYQLPTQVIGKDSNGGDYVKYNYEYIVQ